ncbi:FUSC family protein [Legionella clemsonensis]|uniref:Fusaric acid resistance protein family protein n=1 Tax=Legionella clemsonensis TaxID=1867846 RepID=A0A222NZV5_9GAMM|nr:FUSC family protein [Legionella clemsonensis]ASQ45143.1 Fusaric acid resistance protein family protein [Legionella clemsonensis]
MKIRNTTRMAFQAAIAIAITELINRQFEMDHGYWATLTAMALTAQTWGESVKRSIERVLMTILGGVCGTFLYFILPPSEILTITILLVFIFFTVYLLTINNLIAVFTLTGFVVFFFALLDDWNFLLLTQRIEETALGALIAVLVGFFFLPVKTNVTEIFIAYLEKMDRSIASIFGTLPQEQLIIKQDLLMEFQKIRKQALSIRYEVFFHRMTMRDFNSLLTQILFCTQYIANVIEAYQWLCTILSEEDKKNIAIAVHITQHNIQVLVKLLNNFKSNEMISAQHLLDILDKAITLHPKQFVALNDKALGFYNLMYFFARLNTRLHDSYSLLLQLSD